MDEKNIVVLITAPSPEVGKEIARHLVSEKLAACVNILAPMHSIYTWQGAVQEESEALLIVKTRAEIFEHKLIPAVRAIHPYDVPEIIALPILSGLPAYLDWIQNSTG